MLKDIRRRLVTIDERLEALEERASPKETFSLMVSSDKSDWTTDYAPALYLDPKKAYDVVLLNLETYNSISNVASANNTFVYRVGKKEWKTITIEELTQNNPEIQRQMEVVGDWNEKAEKKVA